MLLASAHLGRAELRLAKLDDMPPYSQNMYNLRHRKNCYIHLNELKIRGPELEEDLTGQVELEISYQPTTESTPVIRFLAFENVSTITLTPNMPDSEDQEKNEASGTPGLDVATEEGKTMVVKAPKSTTPPNYRIFDPAVVTEAAESRALGQPEVISLFKRFLGYVMSNEEYVAVRNFLDMATAFGQGIEVGSMALFVGFGLLQKYFKTLPKEFGNNLILRKKDLELPRVMHKYTMGTLGWRGLNFFGKGQGIVHDSLRSEADLKAVLEFLNMAKSDLLIFELGEARIFRPNFFVCIDRGLSAVILSIRGTMSLSDSITDFACEYIKYRGGLVHSGFFEAARWFMENICHQLLIFAKEYELDNIYICGHSLGGSTSVLTTMLLVDELRKEKGLWPKNSKGEPINIHCYAYGAAPVITRELCEDYMGFVDVFVFGEDIVPRMSYGSFIDFQIMLVYAAEIGRAHHLFKDDISPKYFDKLEKVRVAMHSQQPPMNLKLYIPGRIHHMMKLKAPGMQKYTVIDTCTCDRFRDGHVTRKMLTHHMPSKYESALEDAYLLLVNEEVERMNHPEISSHHLQDAVDEIMEGDLLDVDSMNTPSPPPDDE